MWKYGYKPFNHIYRTGPIDFFDNAIIPGFDEMNRVLSYMPEPSRDGNVYKVFVPDPDRASLEPVYLCKADNNGTVYIFSDTNVMFKTKYWDFEEVKQHYV